MIWKSLLILASFGFVACKIQKTEPAKNLEKPKQDCSATESLLKSLPEFPGIEAQKPVDTSKLSLTEFEAQSDEFSGGLQLATSAVEGTDYVMYRGCLTSNPKVCFPVDGSWAFDLEEMCQMPSGIIRIQAKACSESPLDPQNPCSPEQSLMYEHKKGLNENASELVEKRCVALNQIRQVAADIRKRITMYQTDILTAAPVLAQDDAKLSETERKEKDLIMHFNVPAQNLLNAGTSNLYRFFTKAFDLYEEELRGNLRIDEEGENSVLKLAEGPSQAMAPCASEEDSGLYIVHHGLVKHSSGAEEEEAEDDPPHLLGKPADGEKKEIPKSTDSEEVKNARVANTRDNEISKNLGVSETKNPDKPESYRGFTIALGVSMLVGTVAYWGYRNKGYSANLAIKQRTLTKGGRFTALLPTKIRAVKWKAFGVAGTFASFLMIALGSYMTLAQSSPQAVMSQLVDDLDVLGNKAKALLEEVNVLSEKLEALQPSQP